MQGNTTWLVLALVLSLTGVAWAQGGKDDAKAHFDKGVLLFKNSDFDGALVEFKAAYAMQPHYAVRYNIGITLFKLQRYSDAQLELSAYIEEGGEQIPAERKAEVGEILVELKSLLGTLKVTTSVDGAVLEIDGRQVDTWTLKLEVGEHTVEILADGYEPYSTKIELPGGEVVNVHANLVPEKSVEAVAEVAPPQTQSRKKLVPAPFWTVFGTTVALGAAAAVTGGLVVKQDAEYDNLTYEDEDWRAVRSKGKNLALATDVLLGLTGAAAVTTIVLAVFTDFKGEADPGNVSMFVGPGSLAVSGSF